MNENKKLIFFKDQLQKEEIEVQAKRSVAIDVFTKHCDSIKLNAEKYANSHSKEMLLQNYDFALKDLISIRIALMLK